MTKFLLYPRRPARISELAQTYLLSVQANRLTKENMDSIERRLTALLAGQLDYRADIDELVRYAWAAMLSRQWARCDEVLSIVDKKIFEFEDKLKKNNVSHLCKMMACIRDLGDHIQ